MKVLVIEDDPEIIETMHLCISMRWPQSSVVSARRGREGLTLVESAEPDVVMLDLKLPDMDGLDVLQEVRMFSTVPVLIVTARGDEISRAKGLESGADDYIVKPFFHTELLARINAVMRRTQLQPIGEQTDLMVGSSLTIDLAKRRVYREQEEVNLTPIEWGLLSYLARNEGRVVPHQVVAERVWGSDSISDSALKMTIHRLRQKLGDDAKSPRIIRSHRGMGYRFELPKVEEVHT